MRTLPLRHLAPAAVTAALILALGAPPSHAFCGFYVARGDAKLLNKASQVLLVRDADRTVLTMASDFQGEPTEFAMVVPVPTVLRKEQIHVGDPLVLAHLDAFTAPRLVEYFDPDPCLRAERNAIGFAQDAAPSALKSMAREGKKSGVTIEARYTIGEYDILILSAKESVGLERWLVENGYRVPPMASKVLAIYLKQGMKFFVAKVNVKEHARLGFTSLRPIQMAFESPKFMLPLRLGMANSDGKQEMVVYAITRGGRVETVNYRTVKAASDLDIPLFVRDKFGEFYRDVASHQAESQPGVVFTEYAWNMSWCDPCAADPLSRDELRSLGVFWLGSDVNGGGAQEAFVTRLRVTYDAQNFPEDLALQVTADQSNFQARYVMRHPWKGDTSCPGYRAYQKSLVERQEQQARNLASLTGWKYDRIVARMKANNEWVDPASITTANWWDGLWKN
jgi:hypothetical protein